MTSTSLNPVLRIASSDLHDHVVRAVGSCFESGSYCDLILRCGPRPRKDMQVDESVVHAHRVVLSAVSPYLRHLLETCDSSKDGQLSVELPESTVDEVKMLIEVIYNGVIEATLPELRALIFLARDLRIQIPVSAEMLRNLDIELPPPPQLPARMSSLSSMPPLVHPAPSLSMRPPMAIPPSAMIEPRPMTSSSLTLKRPNASPPSINGPPPMKRSLSVGTSCLSSPPLPLLPVSLLPRPATAESLEELICALCNSKYSSMESWRNHMKYHEEENLKAAKNEMMNDMVAQSYSPLSNLYTCNFCSSTYSHPGNFKQHLGKHERESNCVSTAYGLQLPASPPPPLVNNNSPADGSSSSRPAAGPSSSPHPALYESAASGSAHLNSLLKHVYVDKVEKESLKKSCGSSSHLNNLLQGSFADKVDKGLAGDDGTFKKLYHCEVCGRSFKHPGNYKQHMASHLRLTTTGPPMRLPESVATIPAAVAAAEAGALAAVAASIHGAARGYLDEACASSMGGSSKQRKVVKTANKCDICDEVFLSEGKLQEHKSVNHQISFRPPSPGFLSGTPPLNRISPSFKIKKYLPSRSSSAASEQGVDPLEQGQISPPVPPNATTRRPPPPPRAPSGDSHLFHCDATMCFESFSKECYLTKHQERDHKEDKQSFKCGTCETSFQDKLVFKKHLETANGIDSYNNFECQQCTESFPTSQQLLVHNSLVHTDANGHFNCQGCGRTFFKEAKLKKHQSRGCSAIDDDDEEEDNDLDDGEYLEEYEVTQDEEDLLFNDEEEEEEEEESGTAAMLVKTEVIEGEEIKTE